jgi:outer membrane immunogenic protein
LCNIENDVAFISETFLEDAMIRSLVLSSAAILVAAGSALAADLPSRQAPPPYIPPPIPIFSWTGFYIGGQVGYAWGRDSSTLNTPIGTFGFNNGFGQRPSGVIGGAHLGYNYQINQFLIGIEGDVDGTSLSRTFAPGFGDTFGVREQIEGSVRGRIGYAFDRFLVYGTGGVAFSGIKHTFQTPFGYDSFTRSRTGWTAGGGIEYAITNNWSIRAEYRFSDFGHFNDNLFNSFAAPGTFMNHRYTENRVQAGFSYKFDSYATPAPVVAKY